MEESGSRGANNGLLGLLGLVKKAGKLETGDEPVSQAVREHRARLIFVAKDAAEGISRKGQNLAGKNCPTLVVPYTKVQLGIALGRENCALLAVCDSGFAAALVKKLSAVDPARYAATGDELEHRAEKKLRRRREKQTSRTGQVLYGRGKPCSKGKR